MGLLHQKRNGKYEMNYINMKNKNTGNKSIVKNGSLILFTKAG